ncbi:4-carboxy-4-hydroxy-2-oxoadipate aldolase/oxaloacetate decarboxylase [Siculibacillus lacustris]|uniref:4-carboxy-4-hydroxy-2-oxoadipate aldolase/oxaloacetate decarboxylase n=1 Tax=Siculibacillus lacustris TaxID=1549641 RepID=A0A4Q9VY18_9HYPH|nr:4-carboxy-4-hydroxy-2-oxoadipate aldolase/oxaloacetate decarboxylase [Siculibacillus lacustris]TBW41280.1 4-carboxy-4-hydroxy-2-oxoadipate aldolase/oxaloacetate decarboxylase [Siculibacillus lacustris]
MTTAAEPIDVAVAYRTVTAATAHEAMGRKGALDSAIKPIRSGMRVLGRAFTCSCPPGDNLTLHAALKLAKPGEVIVVAAAGFTEQGLFGEVMASSAKARGLAGLVVDGGVRDSAQIHALGFPVFARAVSIKGAIKETLGELGKPVVVGGELVSPGDLVIGDDDGVVVIPAAAIPAIAVASAEREAKEARFRAALLRGDTTWEMLNLNALMAQKGSDFRL